MQLHYCLKCARIQVYVALIFLDLCDSWIRNKAVIHSQWLFLLRRLKSLSVEHYGDPRQPTLTFSHDETSGNKGILERNCFKIVTIFPLVLCTNWTKKHLLKTHFIAPKLSHLIKLTVTEQATRGGSGGDWEIVSCHTYVALKCTFHSPVARWSFQVRRGQCPSFKMFQLKVSSKWHSAAIWLHHCLQHLGL